MDRVWRNLDEIIKMLFVLLLLLTCAHARDYTLLCEKFVHVDVRPFVNQAHFSRMAVCMFDLGITNSEPVAHAHSLCSRQECVTPLEVSECVVNLACRIASQCAPSQYQAFMDHLVLKDQEDIGKFVTYGNVSDVFRVLHVESPCLAYNYVNEMSMYDPRQIRLGLGDFVENELLWPRANSDCVKHVLDEFQVEMQLRETSIQLQQVAYWTH